MATGIQSSMLKILPALLFVKLLLTCHAVTALDSSDGLLEATDRQPLGLIVSGASSWTIVVPNECTPQEREAALQLSAVLAEATGAHRARSA